MRLRLKKGRMTEGGEKTEEQETDEAGAEAAGFGKAEDWERVRISIPLDRIIKNEVSRRSRWRRRGSGGEEGKEGGRKRRS